MLKTSDVGIQIEVEADRRVVVVLDRPTEAVLLPWQDAFELASTLGLAIADARNRADLINPAALRREQAQIRIGVYGGKVSLVLASHSDRVRYSWRSAEVFVQALRIKAQDVQFAERKHVRLPTLTREEAKSIR